MMLIVNLAVLARQASHPSDVLLSDILILIRPDLDLIGHRSEDYLMIFPVLTNESFHRLSHIESHLTQCGIARYYPTTEHYGR